MKKANTDSFERKRRSRKRYLDQVDAFLEGEEKKNMQPVEPAQPDLDKERLLAAQKRVLEKLHRIEHVLLEFMNEGMCEEVSQFLDKQVLEQFNWPYKRSRLKPDNRRTRLWVKRMDGRVDTWSFDTHPCIEKIILYNPDTRMLLFMAASEPRTIRDTESLKVEEVSFVFANERIEVVNQHFVEKHGALKRAAMAYFKGYNIPREFY